MPHASDWTTAAALPVAARRAKASRSFDGAGASAGPGWTLGGTVCGAGFVTTGAAGAGAPFGVAGEPPKMEPAGSVVFLNSRYAPPPINASFNRPPKLL